MNKLIRLKHCESRGVIPAENQTWCAMYTADTERTLCGDAIDTDNVIEADYKAVKRGGITCPFCLEVIRHVKTIKL
ncbi:hypothetical protein [Vibrio parahaemolyticus]|uniref:hypothetical protein n=1 Tax=Vibrio parahaemolyticus TaxID=670 RepID=UPI003D819F71